MKLIALDVAREGDSTKETINGLDFFVSVSPYFFPDHLECEYKPGSGTLHILVRYPDSEEAVPFRDVETEPIRLLVGRHSKRLLGVDVKVDTHNIDRVRLLVAQHVPAAIAEAKMSLPTMAQNLDSASASIRLHGEEIASAVA